MKYYDIHYKHNINLWAQSFYKYEKPEEVSIIKSIKNHLQIIITKKNIQCDHQCDLLSWLLMQCMTLNPESNFQHYKTIGREIPYC